VGDVLIDGAGACWMVVGDGFRRITPAGSPGEDKEGYRAWA